MRPTESFSAVMEQLRSGGEDGSVAVSPDGHQITAADSHARIWEGAPAGQQANRIDANGILPVSARDAEQYTDEDKK